MAFDPISITEEVLQELVEKAGPKVLEVLIPHYPETDFSAIKRPALDMNDARDAALKGSQ